MTWDKTDGRCAALSDDGAAAGRRRDSGWAHEREGRERRQCRVNEERVTLGPEEKSRVNGPPR